MDRIRLRRALAAQRAYCEQRSPFYAAVLRELEADAHAAWLEAAEHAWRDRRFAVDWEAAHLLLACLHFWALRGASDEPQCGGSAELAALYPSCGGPGGDPGGAVKAFLDRAPAEFWERLRVGTVQTNEVGRSIAWMLAAAAAFGGRGMPFHLVELGASAGLNLIGDHLPQACRFTGQDAMRPEPPAGWNRVHPALTRTGLDLCPRRLSDPQDRLWLKACVWADDFPRLERLDRATGIFLHLEGKPGGPQLVRCAFADAPAWLLANRRARPQQGLLVFNSIATIYLDEADYGSLRRGMASALAPWQDRALWVEYERARGASAGPLELMVHRVVDGRLQSRVLASGAPRPVELRVHEHWGFLGEGESLMR
jgi:hypothetical protein